MNPVAGLCFTCKTLTALNEYANQTHTALSDTVVGEWPELGFSLPPTEQDGLPAGKEVVLSDAFVDFSTIYTDDD